MKHIKILMSLFFLAALLPVRAGSLQAGDAIRIVATTTTFADLAGRIAGDRAQIYAIASPKRDLHFISVTPRDVLKLKKADVFIHGGLDLEAWRAPLVDASGRPEFLCPSGSRQIDVSAKIPLLEVPDSVSRVQGDIHAYGNPHYWLDPENGRIIARNIAEGLSRLYPEDADTFQANEKNFEAQLDQKMLEWQALLAPFKGAAVITYHRSWAYFARRFELEVAGELEPKPGIPPTARHIAELEKVMQEKRIRVVMKETYFENRSAEKIAASAGARVLNLAQAAGELKETRDYLSMLDYDVRLLAQALGEKEVSHE